MTLKYCPLLVIGLEKLAEEKVKLCKDSATNPAVRNSLRGKKNSPVKK